MTARFTDKIALVTGAGSGIGRATALGFSREGAIVVAAGRNPDSLADTVKAVKDSHGRADAIPTDVTKPEEIARLVRETVDRFGGLHIAVNNAGTIGRPAPLADLTIEDWDHVIATNTTGLWLSMKHEIDYMRGNGGGVIVNIASTIGAHGTIPNMGAYAASKAAVTTLTRTAAKEYVGHGIRINAVSPGPIDTAMSLLPGESSTERAERMKAALPIGRVGTLNEAAETILWLASTDAGYVVGHDLVVDGGAAA